MGDCCALGNLKYSVRMGGGQAGIRACASSLATQVAVEPLMPRTWVLTICRSSELLFHLTSHASVPRRIVDRELDS